MSNKTMDNGLQQLVEHKLLMLSSHLLATGKATSRRMKYDEMLNSSDIPFPNFSLHDVPSI